jgi:predicted RNase H-like HicB family nuclease/metal-responsive CopG/Arc/MetJ family transcriptional regulator
MQVVALIDEDNGVYGASFPDFPGCVTTANDPDEVLTKAAEVLALHISGMIADGRDLPQVRPLSRLVDDRTFLESSAGAMVALVPYSPANRPVNLTITIDEALLARIDQAANAAGESRSKFLAEAAQERLAMGAGSERSSMERTPTRVEVQPAAEGEAEHDATPDGADDLHSAQAASRTVLVTEPFSAEMEPIDTATSLATIREILEHLDQSGVKQGRPTELRPAKCGHA